MGKIETNNTNEIFFKIRSYIWCPIFIQIGQLTKAKKSVAPLKLGTMFLHVERPDKYSLNRPRCRLGPIE